MNQSPGSGKTSLQPHRREFMLAAALGGAGIAADESRHPAPGVTHGQTLERSREASPFTFHPARWLWYPSGRCLQNTFILFRKSIHLREKPARAAGWVLADSRYSLEVNGKRVQWGPGPCDPRWMEAGPFDITDELSGGENCIGATVIFFGQGDGTWPVGKPGFILRMEIEYADGSRETLATDSTWLAHYARAWKPGQYKRWYLRALQEEFDARLYPYGWNQPGFRPDESWLPAMELECPPDKPPLCSTYPEYMLEIRGDPETCGLREREIPFMREIETPAIGMPIAWWIHWKRPPEEYFETKTPNAFSAEPNRAVDRAGGDEWRVAMARDQAAALTFELAEQVVGWPHFSIDAPEGTIVELLIHEAHNVGGPSLLSMNFNSWSRFTCREGLNRFETFDFESARWIQLHIRNAGGAVTVSGAGIRRRVFPFPKYPDARCSDPSIQKLIGAAVNTTLNCAQDAIVDCMNRERQQYSGDAGHQIHALYLACGERRLPKRYINTFSQGLTLDGYFLDCWPAYDRLARIMERQLGLTQWGPLLDHGVGLVQDCHHHYMHTGDLEAVREPYPRLLRFAAYLKSIQEPNGLLPVEDLGVPAVWIDHDAYREQRHKRCAFNLYAAAMLEYALAPLCEAFGDAREAKWAREFAAEIHDAAVRDFWDPARRTFVNNRPWLAAEDEPRLCDRSLATAILYGQCPGGRIEESARILDECPPEMGFSYPANQGWRLWALAAAGRGGAVVRELRERWATLDSVRLNNTLSEGWNPKPDTSNQWSHCPLAPLYVLYTSVAGVKPLSPGFKRCEIRPQPGDLNEFQLNAQTILGPLGFKSEGNKGNRVLRIDIPGGMEAELVIDARENPPLEMIDNRNGLKRFSLPGDKSFELITHFT